MMTCLNSSLYDDMVELFIALGKTYPLYDDTLKLFPLRRHAQMLPTMTTRSNALRYDDTLELFPLRRHGGTLRCPRCKQLFMKRCMHYPLLSLFTIHNSTIQVRSEFDHLLMNHAHSTGISVYE